MNSRLCTPQSECLDPMLFEDTVVSKIMEDFNTKCYVMNNEGKAFSIKTILGNFVFINEENKSKEIQGKNVLSFTKFVLGGFVRGVFVGVFCPDTLLELHKIFRIFL